MTKFLLIFLIVTNCFVGAATTIVQYINNNNNIFWRIATPNNQKKLAHKFLFKRNLAAIAAGGTQCTDSCTSEMQKLIDASPFFSSEQRENFNKNATLFNVQQNTFFGGSNNSQSNFMSNFFSKICNSYDKVDVCLTNCESLQLSKDKNNYLNYHSNSWANTGNDFNTKDTIKSNSGITMNLRQVYAGLQFICKERRNEFFAALPCLSEHEPNAMLKCGNEINRSQETTLLFTNSIVNREFHSIQLRFGTLCRDLNTMMKCMEPTIRRGCGDQPTNLMLSFIGLEFSSFERLNEQLGFDQPLPQACRQLIQYSHERRYKQNLRREKNRKNFVISRQHFSINVNSSKKAKTNTLIELIIIQLIIWSLNQILIIQTRSVRNKL